MATKTESRASAAAPSEAARKLEDVRRVAAHARAEERAARDRGDLGAAASWRSEARYAEELLEELQEDAERKGEQARREERQAEINTLRAEARRKREEARALDGEIERLRSDPRQYEPVPGIGGGQYVPSTAGHTRPRANGDLVRLRGRQLNLRDEAAKLETQVERLEGIGPRR